MDVELDSSNVSAAGCIEVWGSGASVPTIVHILDEFVVLAALKGVVITSASIEELRVSVEGYTNTEASVVLGAISHAGSRVLELKDDVGGIGGPVEVLLQEGHHVDNLGIVG